MQYQGLLGRIEFFSWVILKDTLETWETRDLDEISNYKLNLQKNTDWLRIVVV